MEVILTEVDIFKHIHDHHLINTGPSELFSSIQSIYDVELSKCDKSKLKTTFLKMKTYRKRVYSKREKLDWEEIVCQGSDDIDVITVVLPEIANDEKEALEDSFQSELIKAGYKPFKELDRKQQQRRISPLVKLLRVTASYYDTSEEELLEVLGSKGTQKKEKIGQVPLITALTLYQECELGRRRYTKQKKLLKAAGYDILPSYKQLNKFKKKLIPEIRILPEPYVGVYVDLEEAVMLSMQRLMETGQVEISDTAELSMKYGFDGSGSHHIYNQKGNVETNNMLLSVFCPLSIKENDKIIWQESTPNSASAQKPYCLQMGKESVEQYHAQDQFQASILKMEEGITVNDKSLTVKSTLSCDRKASDLVFGNGGAFCDLCTRNKEACEDVENIKNGFDITKTVQELWQIYENVKDEDEENEVIKRPGDYEQRQGVCHKPTICHETHSYQILHARLRTFDTFMEAMVRAYGGMNYWGHQKTHSKTIYKNFKKKLQEFILDKTHVHWDYPNQQGGTSTTGKIAKDLLEKFLQEIIVTLKEADQRKFNFFGTQLASILRTLNTKDYVNVEHYQSICTGLYVFIRTDLQWVSITPTMHKLLGHTWELIEMNDSKGLGELDESGLEACNKLLRRFRTHLGRKTSQIENLTDTFTRFWLNGDEEVNQQRKQTLPWCKTCKVRGHSTRYCYFKYAEEGPLKQVDALVSYMKSKPEI